MTGRHGRPKIDFPGTHGRPSGGRCPILPKHPLFGTNESPSLQIIDTRLKDICAERITKAVFKSILDLTSSGLLPIARVGL